MLLRGTAPKYSLSGDLLHKGMKVFNFSQTKRILNSIRKVILKDSDQEGSGLGAQLG